MSCSTNLRSSFCNSKFNDIRSLLDQSGKVRLIIARHAVGIYSDKRPRISSLLWTIHVLGDNSVNTPLISRRKRQIWNQSLPGGETGGYFCWLKQEVHLSQDVLPLVPVITEDRGALYMSSLHMPLTIKMCILLHVKSTHWKESSFRRRTSQQRSYLLRQHSNILWLDQWVGLTQPYSRVPHRHRVDMTNSLGEMAEDRKCELRKQCWMRLRQ